MPLNLDRSQNQHRAPPETMVQITPHQPKLHKDQYQARERMTLEVPRSKALILHRFYRKLPVKVVLRQYHQKEMEKIRTVQIRCNGPIQIWLARKSRG